MSLANLETMGRMMPDAVTAFVQFKDTIFKDGALTTKEKALIALALGCALKCNTCIESNAAFAKQMGATKQELNEAMMVAMYMAGPSSVVWTTKVAEVLK